MSRRSGVTANRPRLGHALITVTLGALAPNAEGVSARNRGSGKGHNQHLIVRSGQK